MSSKKSKIISRTAYRNGASTPLTSRFSGRQVRRNIPTWQGLTIYSVYIAYVIWTFFRLRQQYQSHLLFLNWFLQEWLSVTLLLLLASYLTNRKSR